MGYRGGWLARRDATETGRPRYDGKVGSSVAGRLQVVASQAEALRLWRSRDEDVVQMARKALMERTNGLLGGGGGGRWRRRAARSHTSQQLFPCFLLLPRDQVKGERGRRAGWARSASRRVAVVAAHLRRPGRALSALPSLPIDGRDALQLTERVPARVSQVADARPPNPGDPAPAPTTRESPGAQSVVAGPF